MADDLAAIRAVRDGAGDDIKLMVDFNQGLSLRRCVGRCHALDDQGLYWFEEPIAYNNLAGYAQLARELKRRCSLARISTARAICINAVQRAGLRLRHAGSDADRRRQRLAARRADRRRRRASRSRPIFIRKRSAHCLRATETAHWLEWQDWADPVLKEPFPVRDGLVEIPDRPGPGIDWDEAAVKRYRLLSA